MSAWTRGTRSLHPGPRGSLRDPCRFSDRTRPRCEISRCCLLPPRGGAGPGATRGHRAPALRTVVDDRDIADGHLIDRHRPCQKSQGLQLNKHSGYSSFTAWPGRAHASRVSSSASRPVIRSASTVAGIQRKRVSTTRRDPEGVQTSHAITAIATTKRDRTE